MQIQPNTINNKLVVTVEEDRIDAAGSIHFKDEMRMLASKHEGPIVLNLEKVDFVDSSGLGAIVASMKLLAPENRLELASLRPPVSRVFALTHLDSVFTIYDSLGEALGSESSGN